MDHGRRVGRALAAAMAMALLAGCGDLLAETWTEEADDAPAAPSEGAEPSTSVVDDAEEQDSATGADEGSSSGAGGDGATDASDGSATAGAATAAPSEPLAVVEGGPDFTLLEILDLRRDGDAVTVDFAITADPDGRSTSTVDLFAAPEDQFNATGGGVGLHDPRRTQVSGVTLVDRVNGNRHLVLRDSKGSCLCTRFDGMLGEGERAIHSAQFPAPPDDVETMTVVVPQFPSVDAVPIRRIP